MLRRAPALVVAALVVAPLGACSGDDPEPAGGHTHAGARVSLPVGDGTQAYEVGYSLTRLSLPERADRAGEVRFVVEGPDGEPVTSYLEEQTKELHLYVVREDLAVFRHLHPTRGEGGEWRAPVSLPSGGDYRVVAEFVAEDQGGNGDHVILGDELGVAGGQDAATGGTPGAGTTVEASAATDPFVQVDVARAPTAGPDGRLELVVRDSTDRPLPLDTYLGTHAHVTGFHRGTGSMVHLHPMAEPQVTDDGSSLSFHSEIERAGDYLLFVQVRVEGFVHTVPVELRVT